MTKSTKTTRLLRSMKRSTPEVRTPIGSEIYLPNHSGVSNSPEVKTSFIRTDGSSITIADIPFAEAIKVTPISNVFSQIGPDPINPTVSNAIDRLVVVKNSDAGTTLRAILASTAYIGSGDRNTDAFSLNSFFIWTGTGNSNSSNNAGVAASRFALRCRTTTSGTTIALGGGASSRAQIQGTANGFTITDAYAYLAEGNQCADANSEVTTSYNFWGRNFGTQSGTLTNNWGFIQEELTDGTYNIEFGVFGAGIYAFRIAKGSQPTEFLNSDTIGHVDIDATISVDINAPILNTLGFSPSLVSKTANYTATLSDHTIICGSGNETFTISLLAASLAPNFKLNIKNIGTGTITVDGNEAETIDGSTTAVLSSQYGSITIQCDGTEWWII